MNGSTAEYFAAAWNATMPRRFSAFLDYLQDAIARKETGYLGAAGGARMRWIYGEPMPRRPLGRKWITMAIKRGTL